MKIELAIYEHKAALLGLSPREVAYNADLLAQSVLTEWETYDADYLTVGLDIYNVEAEACGALVSGGSEKDCPVIRTPLFSLDALPARLPAVDVRNAGRFPLLLQAGLQAAAMLQGEAKVRVGISGPCSFASRLVGISELMAGLLLQPEACRRLLDYCLDICLEWISLLANNGLEVVIFDSAASPPLISPALYRNIIQPYHAGMMERLSSHAQEERPLIVGGDTGRIVRDMFDAGANYLICDYSADPVRFAAEAAKCRGLIVRRNIDPAALMSGETDLGPVCGKLCRDMSLFEKPIAGTGILPYDIAVVDVWRFLTTLKGLSAEYTE